MRRGKWNRKSKSQGTILSTELDYKMAVKAPEYEGAAQILQLYGTKAMQNTKKKGES